jgi:hypothetical protein
LRVSKSSALDVALKTQNAQWVPAAFDFHTVYLQRVTAIRDGTEVWKWEPTGQSGLERMLNPAVKRTVKILKRGDTLEGIVSPVRREENPRMAAFAGSSGAVEVVEILTISPPDVLYVAYEDVQVRCIPRDSIKRRLPYLTEINWQPE